MKKFDSTIPVDKPVKISDQINQEQFGELLLGVIAQAIDMGIDTEAALRAAAKSLISKIEDQPAR
jgi:XTP/dITP diphosphohydrolase